MSKTVSSAVLTELNAGANYPITLFEFIPAGATQTIRLAEFDTDVYWDGNKYDGFPLSHADVKTNLEETIDSIRVTVSNVNLFMSSLLLHNNGFRQGKVTVRTVFQNLLDSPEDSIMKFQGYISSCTVNADVASFEVTSSLDVQDQVLPNRIFRRRVCGWLYKDPLTCKYAGPLAQCDKTLEGENGCRVHSNLSHFGGFPGIPEARGRIQ